MFFCAISGTVPISPVVSTKSGHVYEKALIARYIDENGNDPVTGEGLTLDDLVDVKAKPSTLPPRAPTQTSIPSLLNSLQSEFDAIMLESLEIKKSYKQSRQELANALYRSDAAERAIARLIKERDEARNALASIQATIGTAPSAETPQAQTQDVEMDGGANAEEDAVELLPKDVVEVITSTNTALSATRRKRKAAPGYSNADAIKGFTQISSVPSLHATKPAGITALDLSPSGTLALTGGADKTAQIYDLVSGTTVATLKGHTKAVEHVAFVDATEGSRTVVTGGADKTVKLWSESGSKWSLAANFKDSQKGEIVGIAVHPSKRVVASASSDSTWALHDVSTHKTIAKYEPVAGVDGSFAYTSFTGHPDGILHGCGTIDGSVRIWDVRDKSVLAGTVPSHASAVTTLSFSENGYLLATASATDPTVNIIDLRKLATVQSWTLPAENKIKEVRFDYSAQFLTVVGTDARIYANKSWQELLKFDDNAGELTGARFGPLGQQLVLSGMDRTLRVLGTA